MPRQAKQRWMLLTARGDQAATHVFWSTTSAKQAADFFTAQGFAVLMVKGEAEFNAITKM